MLKFRAVRLAALVFLIVGVGTECFVTRLSVLDLDIWWHLSAGTWMVQQHAFTVTSSVARFSARLRLLRLHGRDCGNSECTSP